MMGNNQWGLRDVLAPILSRMINYGANQFDIEYAFRKMEQLNLLHSRILEENWYLIWNELAEKYLKNARQAEVSQNFITSREMYFNTSSCYYAASLINYREIDCKKQIYLKCVEAYKNFIKYVNPPVELVEVPVTNKKSIPGILYHPDEQGLAPCIIIISGIGTSKEETYIFAKPFVDRGIAVLTIDLPGTGESLFGFDLKFSMAAIEHAGRCILDFLLQRNDIDPEMIGIYGICMGGALAFKLAARDKRIGFCATLFPLQIELTRPEQIPAWMRNSNWTDFFSGFQTGDAILADVSIKENEFIECPFFMIHSNDDNWMPTERAMQFSEKAKGDKKIYFIEEKAILGRDQKIIHTMPVAEQQHWVKHLMADWIKNHISDANRKR